MELQIMNFSSTYEGEGILRELKAHFGCFLYAVFNIVGELAAGKGIKDVLMLCTHDFEKLILTLTNLSNRNCVHKSVNTTIQNGNLLAYSHW